MILKRKLKRCGKQPKKILNYRNLYYHTALWITPPLLSFAPLSYKTLGRV